MKDSSGYKVFRSRAFTCFSDPYSPEKTPFPVRHYHRINFKHLIDKVVFAERDQHKDFGCIDESFVCAIEWVIRV